MEIRELELHDAANFVDLLEQIEEESKVYAVRKAESESLVQISRRKTSKSLASSQTYEIIVAEESEVLVGYIAATGAKLTETLTSLL